MTNNDMTVRILLFALLGAPILTACTGPSATEKEFGSSVRHMISQQSYRPGEEATGLEGEKSRYVLDAYRRDVAKPETVEKKVININLD